MKKILCLLTALILMVSCWTSVLAEDAEEETLLVPVVMGTGTRPSNRTPAVVPFADVNWGDDINTVAEATSGQIEEQDGETVVKAFSQVNGLADEIQVIYSFRDGGLVQVEGIAAGNLAAKISDLSESGAGKALISETKAFFQQDPDPYFWHGNNLELFMCERTTAGIRCRGDKQPYRLSVIYYMPEFFETSRITSLDGVISQEAGDDIQYFPSPSGFTHPLSGANKSSLMYIIRVVKYQKKEHRIPFYGLTFYYTGTKDPGECKTMSFIADGKRYAFSGVTRTNSKGADGETTCIYTANIGEHSLPFWDAMEKAEEPVTFVFDGEFFNMTVTLADSDRLMLVNGFRKYQEANGFSGIALDYISEGEASITVMDWEEIAQIVPAYTLDNSVIPFTELAWNANMNKLAKELGVKPEKDGTVNRLSSVLTIENLGEDLPVTYTFRNNKLSAVSVTIKKNVREDAEFLETPQGQQMTNYIKDFTASHPDYSYTTPSTGMKYILTDVTEICYGIVQKAEGYNLVMEFFPAQTYDVSFLNKTKTIASSVVGNNRDIMYYDNNPFYFEHQYTYNGYYYTKSCINWVIQVREASQQVGRIPIMYYYFEYAGIQNPSSAKWISFAIDNTIYQFALKASDNGKLQKTQYGELTQSFVVCLDGNSYQFLEHLAKGKKIDVTLQGDDIQLTFPLPAKAKQKMLEGKKNYEKLCGLIDGPLTFSVFSGTPMTIY